MPNKSNELITITTEKGLSLQLTNNHPLYVNKVWKYAKDLKINDSIAIITKTISKGEISSFFDLIKGEVVPFDISLHIPHVGWNNIDCKKIHQVFGNHSDHLDFYFVQSYYFKASSSQDVLTTTNYEIDFCSSIVKNNVLGVQFHPEKSQEPGLNFLEKFCTWDGKC